MSQRKQTKDKKRNQRKKKKLEKELSNLNLDTSLKNNLKVLRKIPEQLNIDKLLKENDKLTNSLSQFFRDEGYLQHRSLIDYLNREVMLKTFSRNLIKDSLSSYEIENKINNTTYELVEDSVVAYLPFMYKKNVVDINPDLMDLLHHTEISGSLIGNEIFLPDYYQFISFGKEVPLRQVRKDSYRIRGFFLSKDKFVTKEGKTETYLNFFTMRGLPHSELKNYPLSNLFIPVYINITEEPSIDYVIEKVEEMQPGLGEIIRFYLNIVMWVSNMVIVREVPEEKELSKNGIQVIFNNSFKLAEEPTVLNCEVPESYNKFKKEIKQYTIRPHIRKSHWKRVRFGEGLKNFYRKWFPPTVVNRKLIK